MTSTKLARAATWAAWNAMTDAERAEAGIATVISRDGADSGYADSTSPYGCRCGSPGAVNLRVIWHDGTKTLCCTRGMESSGDEDERMPGGFAEWVIR